MLRILYLSRGGSVGGSQRQLGYVVTNLDHNYEPIVVCRKDGEFVRKLRDCDIATHVLPLSPWRKFPAGMYRYLDAWRLARFARQHEVAIVHSSDLWLNSYSSWVARRLKVPSILHIRTPIRPDEVHKHRCSEATSIVAISRRVRRNLLSAGIGAEKITVIDDAVDLDAFRPEELEENVLKRCFSPLGEVLVGIVGRIDPSKRQLEFLQAVERIVRDSTRGVTFFIIGEVHSDGYFKKLKRFVREKGLGRYVFFTGGQVDMPRVLCSLDILVSLSGGSVMFEAMACGKPVISAGFSTKENSVHIQDGRTGLLISSSQNSELVQVLKQVIDAPKFRSQIGQEARKWAEDNFCHIAMATRTQRLYGQLLQKAGQKIVSLQ